MSIHINNDMDINIHIDINMNIDIHIIIIMNIENCINDYLLSIIHITLLVLNRVPYIDYIGLAIVPSWVE